MVERSGTEPVIDLRESATHEELAEETCRALLGDGGIGRVGFVVGDHPEIHPVTYARDGDEIVFRTGRGSKLGAVDRQADVAFEVDHVGGPGEASWSVLVVGRAERVTDPAAMRRVRELGLHPWAGGQAVYWVRIVPRRVTGRRVVAPEGAARHARP